MTVPSLHLLVVDGAYTRILAAAGGGRLAAGGIYRVFIVELLYLSSLLAHLDILDAMIARIMLN